MRLVAFHVIQKTDVLELLLEESSFAKISFLRGTMEKYLNWKHFGDHDTLFYWSTELFSDGKWRIIGTTKPAKYTGHSMKKPWGTLEYLTEPMSREKIDEMLTNKWEVTKAHASNNCVSYVLRTSRPTRLFDGSDEHEAGAAQLNQTRRIKYVKKRRNRT